MCIIPPPSLPPSLRCLADRLQYCMTGAQLPSWIRDSYRRRALMKPDITPTQPLSDPRLANETSRIAFHRDRLCSTFFFTHLSTYHLSLLITYLRRQKLMLDQDLPLYMWNLSIRLDKARERERKKNGKTNTKDWVYHHCVNVCVQTWIPH